MLGEFLRGWLANHKLIVAPLTACGVTQFIKAVYMYLKERCWRWYWVFSDGGMPSAHSAMVVSLAAGIGFSLGYNSEEFGKRQTVPTWIYSQVYRIILPKHTKGRIFHDQSRTAKSMGSSHCRLPGQRTERKRMVRRKRRNPAPAALLAQEI